MLRSRCTLISTQLDCGRQVYMYEYRDETFKHDAFSCCSSFRLVRNSQPRSHSLLHTCSFHLLVFVFLFKFAHGIRMCCSLSIDSFCELFFLFHIFTYFFVCSKSKSLTHVPCYCITPHCSLFCRTVCVFCPFILCVSVCVFFFIFSVVLHRTHHFVSRQVLVWCTKCIHDLH